MMNETQSELRLRVLEYLKENFDGEVDTLKLAQIFDKNHQEVIEAIFCLEFLEKEKKLFKLIERSRIQLELTKEGQQVLENGSLEVIAYEAVPPGEAGIGLNVLKKLVSPSVRKSGMSKAIKNGWLKVIPENCNVVRLVQKVEDEIRSHLKIVESGETLANASLFELKKRKLLIKKTEKYYVILGAKGKNVRKGIGSNFSAKILSNSSGYLHPLLKMRCELRYILLEMGFSELPSSGLLIGPNADQIGTHLLHEINSAGEIYQPIKLFVINRTVQFKTEKVKATRIRSTILESHQVELLLAGYDLNLGNLIAIIKELLKKLGIIKLRFKPAYNPEMEPSLKALSFIESSKKYEQVGNGGILRPDLWSELKTQNFRVMRWIFSIENIFSIQNGIIRCNINKIIGNRMDLQMTYNNKNIFE